MERQTVPSGETHGHDKTTEYTVNGEAQETTKHKLSGRQILEAAGFAPPADYRLVSLDGDREIGLDEDEPIHENEAFIATFRGVTPTS